MRTNAKLTVLLVLILLALVGNLCALGWLIVHQLKHAREAGTSAPQPPAPAPDASDTAQVAVTGVPVERLHWHEAPLIAAVGGDETEDVVGQYSTTGDDGQESYFLGAFDGATLTRLWRAGPLVVQERGDRPPIAMLAAAHVVAAESSSVHLYDLTTGDETVTVRATDRIVDLCPIAPEKSRVWARVADGKSVTIDVATGDFKPQEARPEGCPFPVRPSKPEGPSVTGFTSAKVLVEADVAVALGAKSPGTPVPMAVGFEPKGKKVRWQHPLAQSEDPANVVTTPGRIADLLEGKLYATYRVSPNGWRFEVLDGKTGDHLWEAVVPEGNASSGSVTVTATRVYLAHASWLDVFEKATGRPIGTIGDHAGR